MFVFDGVTGYRDRIQPKNIYCSRQEREPVVTASQSLQTSFVLLFVPVLCCRDCLSRI